jgi:hypothetical protein
MVLVAQLRHQAKVMRVVLVALTVELLLVGKVAAVAVRMRLELRRHQWLLVMVALAYLLQFQVHLRSMLVVAAVDRMRILMEPHPLVAVLVALIQLLHLLQQELLIRAVGVVAVVIAAVLLAVQA